MIRGRWMSSALALVATVALGLVATPSPASAALTTFRLLNYHSEMCIGIAADGNAGNWYCTRNSDQAWHWGAPSSVDANFRQLINGDNKCLAVSGDSLTLGTRIVGYPCTQTLDQYWAPAIWMSWAPSPPQSWFALMTLHSRPRICAIQGGLNTNGQPVVTWDYQGHEDQWWQQY